MEIIKLLEDMEKTIKEVKELLATFRALQLELEPLAMPVLERSDIPDSPTKFMDALEIAFTEPKKRGRKKKVQA
jgi:hypothetical protein